MAELDANLKDAENEEADNQENEAPVPKKKSKLMLILSLVIAQLIIAAAIIFFFIDPNLDDLLQTLDGKEEQPLPEKRQLGKIYTLSDLTINPKNTMGRRFAVFEVAFEVKDDLAIAEVDKYKPVIKDRFLEYFRTKTVEELTSQMEMIEIKKDLKYLANNSIGQPIIDHLYFTRFVLE